MFELFKRTNASIQVQKDRPIVFTSDLHFDFINKGENTHDFSRGMNRL